MSLRAFKLSRLFLRSKNDLTNYGSGILFHLDCLCCGTKRRAHTYSDPGGKGTKTDELCYLKLIRIWIKGVLNVRFWLTQFKFLIINPFFSYFWCMSFDCMLLVSALYKPYKYCNTISKTRSLLVWLRPDNKLENLLNNLGGHCIVVYGVKPPLFRWYAVWLKLWWWCAH